MAIRYYKTGDEGQIQELFKKVFNKERTLEHWEWKYIKNPQSLNPFILVYEEDQKIIGHIALWVANAYMEGKATKVALRVDTMVDPEARGKGIYRKLNEAMLAEAKESGISLLYGFPAPKAKELLLNTTNANYVEDISRYMLILDPGAIAANMYSFLSPIKSVGRVFKRLKQRKLKKTSLPVGWKVEAVEHCDQRFDQLAEKVKTIKPIMLKRDADYLNWRYLNHPENNYTILALTNNDELQGYVTVNKRKRDFKNGQAMIGFIIDYLAVEDKAVWEILLYSALTELQDVDMIQAWGFPGNIGTESLLHFGFKEKDKPMPLIVHELENNRNRYKNNHDWWLTQGDVDSF
ncbi:GNAT family N-acetyltransferase [Lentibacillus sp. Marseille-P4043]|uniref:GNAT family N-acetyltransferase n=1 Tax=Lentibacillus sp. Marseille-P4043 TaxID=2040293 RepID=UPI000D0B70C4|nr:GNAT family N-acetyltransferase [Lentibacillus sp. Marseille-P4043]